MNAGTIRRRKLLKGVAVKSTADVPYVSWMSVHERYLGSAAEYERQCIIRRENVDPDEIKSRIGGLTVHLEAHALTNGLVTATIHDAKGAWVCDAREYGGVSVKADGNGRTVYEPVTRMARMAGHAFLGSGFQLRYLSGDPALGSVYNRIRKEYSPRRGKEITLEYSIEHHAGGAIELLELQCVVAGAVRTRRLVIDGEGNARVNQAVLNGEKGEMSSAVPGLEFLYDVHGTVANIARAVAMGADFSLADIAKRRAGLLLED